MRGKDTATPGSRGSLGSPPPMRGKVMGNISEAKDYRITPAHAGKRRQYGLSHARDPDHPRPCGEKPVGSIALICSAGSPPPMRGKVLMMAGVGRASGITPAHAGKRRWNSVDTRNKKDHPRPCGEKC